MFGEQELKVRVLKDELLLALKSNRERHAAMYATAKEGFRKVVEKELEKRLKAVREGKKIRLDFDFRKPENHKEEYDDIIGMLELSTDREIELSYNQYQQYYKDKWNWTRGWDVSNAMYLSAAS